VPQSARPFRFLAIAADGTPGGRELAETARRAEALGYSALVLPDHLIGQHAPVPVLATIAAATERLRVEDERPDAQPFAGGPAWN